MIEFYITIFIILGVLVSLSFNNTNNHKKILIEVIYLDDDNKWVDVHVYNDIIKSQKEIIKHDYKISSYIWLDSNKILRLYLRKNNT